MVLVEEDVILILSHILVQMHHIVAMDIAIGVVPLV